MAQNELMDLWALTEWNTPYRKIQQPIPEPQGTEVVVQVTHCGLCHSDLHFYEGFYDMGGGKRFYVKDRGVKLPVAGGHEIFGTVARLGPDAKDVQIGSPQIVYPWLGCASCTRCKQELDNLCAAQRGLGTIQNGGLAEYVVVPHPKYLVDPGDLDPAVACTFGCAGITTMSAVSKIMPLPADDPVLLIGAGGVGLAAISMLKAYGHRNIISVDIGDDKLAAATQAGATQVINSSHGDPAQAILKAVGGPLLSVIDFVNNSKTAAMLNGLVGKGAIWVQVGVMGGSVELSLVGNIFKGLTIYSNITGTVDHLREVTRLAKEGKLPSLPITKMPWDSVNDAVKLLQDGKATGRIILVKS
jgi:alcohol dehydrogenase/propanol-preferring alcohol dehydrogenase